jgi:hypothetical protein
MNIKEVIRIRAIEGEEGKKKVEILVRGNVEELTALLYSAMKSNDRVTESVFAAVNAYAFERIKEENQARLN